MKRETGNKTPYYFCLFCFLFLFSHSQDKERKNYLGLSIGANYNYFSGDRYINDSATIFYGGILQWSSDQRFWIYDTKGFNFGLNYYRRINEKLLIYSGIQAMKRSRLYKIERDSFLYYGYMPEKNHVEYEYIFWYIEIPVIVKYYLKSGFFVEGGFKFSPQYINIAKHEYFDGRKTRHSWGTRAGREFILEASTGYDFLKRKQLGMQFGINYQGLDFWGAILDDYKLTYYAALRWRFLSFNHETFKRKKGLRKWRLGQE